MDEAPRHFARIVLAAGLALGTASAAHAQSVRPDIFNSVAMPVARTPIDGRWNAAGPAKVSGVRAANETLARGRGDCEDYALAKLAMLRRAGFADRDLYLVLVKDLVRRTDHAVLVVRSEGQYLVLDNDTDLVLDSVAVRDYRPILSFAAEQRFAHGYHALAAR